MDRKYLLNLNTEIAVETKVRLADAATLAEGLKHAQENFDDTAASRRIEKGAAD